MSDEIQLSCPTPLRNHATIQMAHGGGGRLMRDLIEGVFLPAFGSEKKTSDSRTAPHDSAVLPLGDTETRIAFTTDTFVVDPIFFPGGDIGKLAVFGTVNDLAMSGAVPHYLSAGVILEEGFSIDALRQIVESMREAAEEVGVRIVTGDTKVVDRGKADGIFINTAGIGVVPPGIDVAPSRVMPGDAVIVSGDLGRHGIAIMSVREGLAFEGAPESDCASLVGLVEQLRELGTDLHCLRDLTRGGLASALNEIATDVEVGIELTETTIPVIGPVAGACELLGLDPLYAANEGRLVAFVPAEAADRAVQIMVNHPVASQAAIIGTVTDRHQGTVEINAPFGGSRILDLLSGEQMPRIC